MKILSALLGGAIFAASCAKPQDLEFIDIQNIRMIKLGLSESQIGIDVRLYNPNNQRVNLKDAAAKVYVNTAFLGDTRMDTTIPVPRRDTFAVPLVVNIQSMTALSKIAQSLSDSLVNIKVEGSVKMGKAGVFRSFPIDYNESRRVEDVMGELQFGF